MSDFILDTSIPEIQFKRHLALEGNKRILFSGPFGSGKTYFLRKFFKDNENYVVVSLAPVNYSVTQNEDIFELIKFDILFHLLNNELFPKNAGISKTDVLRHLSMLDPEKGVRGIFEKANKIGTNILPFWGDKKMVAGIQDSASSADDSSWLKELKDFLHKIKGKSGGIYESDSLTQLLYKLISIIGTERQKIVLLIDDLDRIDPEHIFRILNIFAAHLDLDVNETENKFGFNQIILVCDLENIRTIFSSRYGQNVDFSGYIDKFYSREVFSFDNNKAILEKISTLLHSVKVNQLPPKTEIDSDIQWLFPIQRFDSSVHGLVHYILRALIQVNGTNLRSLFKIYKSNTSFGIEIKKIGRSFHSYHFPLIWVLEFIRFVLGDGIGLRNGIQRCVHAKVGLEIYDGSDDKNHLKMGMIIPVTLIPGEMNSITSTYPLSGGGFVTYNLIRERASWDAFFAQIDLEDVHRVDIFPTLLDVIDIFQRMGFLK